MVNNFQAAMMKLGTLGNTVSALTDCSDVIPISKPAPANTPGFSFFPAGKTMADVEQAVRSTVFVRVYAAVRLTDSSLVCRDPLPIPGH